MDAVHAVEDFKCFVGNVVFKESEPLSNRVRTLWMFIFVYPASSFCLHALKLIYKLSFLSLSLLNGEFSRKLN